MTPEQTPVVPSEPDDNNALSLFPAEDLTRSEHLPFYRPGRPLNPGPPASATPPPVIRREQFRAVNDVDRALDYGEQRIRGLEERTQRVVSRLQQVAELEAILEEQLEQLRKQSGRQTKRLRPRVQSAAAAGLLFARESWKASVSGTSALSHSLRTSAQSLRTSTQPFRRSAISRSAALASSVRQTMLSQRKRFSPAVVSGVVVFVGMVGGAILVSMSHRDDALLASKVNAATVDRRETPAPVVEPAVLSTGTRVEQVAASRPEPEVPVPAPTQAALRPVAESAPAAAPRVVPVSAVVPPSTEPAPRATPRDDAAGSGFNGELEVVTEPAGAMVFVDQQLVGESPISLSKLRAGSHVVRVDVDGYQRWTSAVRVSTGNRALVNARLQPDSSR